ncbi:MAG: choice-of-anchor Q domain-containing protein, partial [Chloroflexota bacterium]
MRKTSLYLLATPTASRKKATLFTCILALLFSVLSIAWSAKLNPAEANTIIYVNQNASGSNNGTTWKNAYTDLQTALAAASSGDEIWVAAGIYVPGTNSFSSFSLVDGVAVYGGFDASETVRAQRDWVNNITILSGDVGGDDTTDSNGVVLDPDDVVGTNIRNIVVGSNLTAATVLDGFTITAGNDAFSGGTASGLALNSSSPTVQNIHFIGNKGLLGGGLSMSNSSSPQIADIIIENNLANSRGGGIYIDNSSPTIQNVSIIGNESLSQGGGIYSVGSVITLTNIAVQGNSTTIDGGGIFLATGDNSVLDNILISGNIASNNSGSEGGGLHIFDSDITISNLTIVGNFASLGGGIANNFGTLNLNNSIVWGNDDNGSNPETASSYENFNASTNIQFSTVESINTFQNSGNNSGSDPLFASTINASDAPTTTGDFQLQSGSPAIDAGSSALYTSASNTDLAGNTRINGSAIDMGVYESNFIPLSLAIDGSGSGSVSATGINCPSDCEEGYAPNTVVTLTATADTGSNFITWSGASGCSNNRVCAVTMDSAKNITATIDLKNYTLGAAIIP